MKRRSASDKVELVLPHLIKAGLVGEQPGPEERKYLEQVVEVVGDRLKVGNQIGDLADFFFKDPITYEGDVLEILKRHYAPAVFSLLEDRLEKLETFEAPSIESVMRGLVSEMGLKTGDLFQPVRVALTGKKHSPDLLKIMQVLGKDRVLKRLRTARRKALENQ